MSLFRTITAMATFFVAVSAYSTGRCEDIFSSEASLRKRMWVGLSRDVVPLNLALNAKPSLYNHFVSVDARARVVLKIANLDGHASEANRVIYNAIKNGKIDEIDAGAVVGPKVLPLILNLARIAPAHKRLIIRGYVRANFINEALLREESALDANGHRNFHHLTEKDIERLHKSTEELGLLEACRKFYGAVDFSACGSMRFMMDARNPRAIAWSKD